MKSDPIQSELLKSSTNPIRTRSGRIGFGFGFGSDSHTFSQNPQVCGKIKTLNVEVKSDCHSTPTSDIFIYHTPQLSTRADSSTIPTHRKYKTSPSTPFHKKPSTITHQLFYTTHHPNTIISQTHNRSREIAISLSAFVSTLSLLYITIRLKRFLYCCWQDRHQNTDEVILMNFTTSSSSGSSTTIYSDSSV